MPTEQVVQFEQKVALLLLTKLEHLQITPERAAEIARYILEAFPEDMSEQKFQKQFENLESKFVELSPIFHELIRNRDQKRTQELVTQIHSSLKTV